MKNDLALGVIAVILGAILSAMFYVPYHERIALETYANEINKPIKVELLETYAINPREVYFTSYWKGEYKENGITSSGLSDKDFIEQDGMYFYNDMVVLGGATDVCLNTTKGACGQYNELPDGYKLHKLFDEVIIELNGINYDGIILDSCGACMRINGDEEYQRYDIFVTDKEHSVGKVKGIVYGRRNIH